jgi:CubicO group peptidase (beta-lactamase class C family)
VAVAVALMLGAVGEGEARGSKPKPPKVPERLSELGVKLDQAVTSAGGRDLWGTVLVAKGGEILLAKGYGFADYEKVPNAPDTLFELASLSKQVTATAILKLEEQKKLRTSDPITKHLKGAPADKDVVTIDHLLHHTAGLDPTLGVPYSWAGARTQYVKEMLAKPLVREPGKAFEYSNVGYALLAAIVEEATGKDFEDYCRKELFEPAGLADTGFVQDKALKESARVTKRRCDDCEPHWTCADWWYGWGYRGMGGVVSTALDLCLWDRALRGEAILGKKAKEKLYTPALDDYACGWKVAKSTRGTPLVSHSGGVRGYATEMARWLEEDVVIVILSNGKCDIFAIERALARLLFP